MNWTVQFISIGLYSYGVRSLIQIVAATRRPNSAKISYRLAIFCVACCLGFPVSAATTSLAGEAQGHPSLVLTKEGISQIRRELGSVPLFDKALSRVKLEVDAEIEQGIDTPIPKDFSGGYTHERHKRNFLLLPKAGALYQILEDDTYARYVRDMLFQYEALYKDLPLHPQERSYARGKLFWQCLNDANWLLYASQGYDAIYEWLSPSERAQLEDNLFRPFADFLSLENPQFFNRIHNHSTWGNSAVGMIGLVMRDQELVERALYGIDGSELVSGQRDDDGGFIRNAGEEVGFLANLDQPFSPDGYYTEGPYYQRYAMYPFLMFGQALNQLKPELGVLEYKDGVLLKAVYSLLQLSDAEGEFFPLNDAQKGMSLATDAMVAAVDIAYHAGKQDPQLLDIADYQGTVTLSDAGFAVALGIRDGKKRAFVKGSVNLSDGPDGSQGGVAVLRAKQDLALVFKYAAQGLGHGHFDKLSLSLYTQGQEVLQDYGLVRFVNIEQKGGGNYLPENNTWAKQTIAHNTITIDQTSHFGGKYARASKHHSELAFFDASNSGVQVVSAFDRNAYPGSELRRTLAVVDSPAFEYPYLLDLFRVSSSKESRRQLDFPFWYRGQHLDATADLVALPVPQVLGKDNGYQHLYLEAKSAPSSSVFQFQWLLNGRFYTLTAAASPGDEVLFARIGANDPEFNLRRDAGLIFRRETPSTTLFASVIESHGSYSPVSELTVNPRGQITDVRVIHDGDDYSAVLISDARDVSSVFIVANQESTATQMHELTTSVGEFRWHGPYLFSELEHADELAH